MLDIRDFVTSCFMIGMDVMTKTSPIMVEVESVCVADVGVESIASRSQANDSC